MLEENSGKNICSSAIKNTQTLFAYALPETVECHLPDGHQYSHVHFFADDQWVVMWGNDGKVGMGGKVEALLAAFGMDFSKLREESRSPDSLE